MSKRRLGVVALLLMLLTMVMAVPATASEEIGHEDPELSELTTGSKTAEEFRPEPYDPPAFFQWFIYPLVGVGVLAALVILGLYLLWQPEFGRQAEEKKRG